MKKQTLLICASFFSSTLLFAQPNIGLSYSANFVPAEFTVEQPIDFYATEDALGHSLDLMIGYRFKNSLVSLEAGYDILDKDITGAVFRNSNNELIGAIEKEILRYLSFDLLYSYEIAGAKGRSFRFSLGPSILYLLDHSLLAKYNDGRTEILDFETNTDLISPGIFFRPSYHFRFNKKIGSPGLELGLGLPARFYFNDRTASAVDFTVGLGLMLYYQH